MGELLQDLRYGLRTLLKAPGFTGAAVLCVGPPDQVLGSVLLPLFSKEFRRQVANVDSVAELAARIDRSMIDGLPAPSPSQYVVFKTDLASYTLNLGGDRTEMANSIEGRLPFLDHKLYDLFCKNFSSNAVSFSHPGRVDRLEARQARVTRES